MCTVSWLHAPDGYQLLCNRDEKHSRRAALGPRIVDRAGVRVIAPADADFGGTWIGANEFGISLCLLNGRPRPAVARLSRGLLVANLLDACSSREVHERAWYADLTDFAPFTLAVLEPGASASIVEWDGREKTIVPYGDPYMPLVSSSFDPDAATALRKSEFARRKSATGRVDQTMLYSFHESHGPQAGPYSPCMHRDDARTVSFSWIKVTEDQVQFFYYPDAPCRWPACETLELARAA